MKVETKLWDLIGDLRMAMMCTVDARSGALRSRPLITLEQDQEKNDLWFLTAEDSAKADEIDADKRVNLSYADNERRVFVSVSGRASVVHDRRHVRRLWSPAHLTWFPDGPDDPRLALLRVHVTKAEYWEGPASMLGRVVGVAAELAKSVVSGEHAGAAGHNEKLELG
jgi:general stress protein 26